MFRRKSPDPHPVALIVGLGNPGAEYKHTRHNVGFDAVEALARIHKIDLRIMKHKASYGLGFIGDVPVALVKPLTFMNLSGQAIKLIAQHYNVAPEKILIIADDLDLPIGKLRMRLDGSPGGHNGHKSIVQSLGTQEYPRLRIGIGKGEDETIDHVLSRFKPVERTSIEEAIKRTVKASEVWATEGPDPAMRLANAP